MFFKRGKINSLERDIILLRKELYSVRKLKDDFEEGFYKIITSAYRGKLKELRLQREYLLTE